MTTKMIFVLGFVLSAIGGLCFGDAPAAGAEPAWLKHTVPGEAHQALDAVVGDWTFTMKWWSEAGAKPEEAKGTGTNKWILGKRFLKQELHSTAMGGKFEGIGFTGYDVMKKEYQATWMDNMSTGMMISSGKWEKGSKIFSATGSASDPMADDANRWFRSEIRVTGKNDYTFSMFAKNKSQEEFKNMEISFKRKR